MSVVSAARTSEGAVALAHGIHYAIVAAGIVGILALLVPQLYDRLAGGRGSRARAPRDLHESRVMLLRAEIASGGLGSGTAVRLVPAVEVPAIEPTLPYAARTLLPVAFVASTAAAGVHAAMFPAHTRESAWFGVFFGLSALFQIVWSAALVVRVTRTMLLVSALANTAFVALWAVTRTLGLPVLLPRPEAVGPWDVTCVAWELLVVVACLRLLGSEPVPERLASWHRWDGRVVAFAVGTVAALAALSFSG